MNESTVDSLNTVDTASEVIDLVRTANPAVQAEVVVDAANSALTRFANSFIHQNVAESTVIVSEGPESTVVSGGVVSSGGGGGGTSTLKVLEAGVPSTLPAVSVALTSKAWEPSGRYE